jgi:hypothetical protein
MIILHPYCILSSKMSYQYFKPYFATKALRPKDSQSSIYLKSFFEKLRALEPLWQSSYNIVQIKLNILI